MWIASHQPLSHATTTHLGPEFIACHCYHSVTSKGNLCCPLQGQNSLPHIIDITTNANQTQYYPDIYLDYCYNNNINKHGYYLQVNIILIFSNTQREKLCESNKNLIKK